MSASDESDDDGSLSIDSVDDLIANLDINKDEQNESTNNNNNQPNDELQKGKKKDKKRMSWMVQGQKALVSKASGSSLGQSLIKQFVDKETGELLDIMKGLIAQDAGEKVAKKAHKTIIKLAVKIILLHEKKILSHENFAGLEFSFRRICSTVKNSFQRSRTLDEATCKRVEQHIRAFETGISMVLTNYVTSSTLKRLEDIANVIARPEFLMKVAKSPEFPRIVMILAYYLEELKEEENPV